MTRSSGPAPDFKTSVSPRKLAERALILPLIGLILLLPPIASIFEIDARWFGIPVTVIYLFVVWALLIVFAFRLSRGLQHAEHNENNSQESLTVKPDSKL